MSAAATSLPQPVAPSLLVRLLMRPMTKVFNPFVRRVAGRSHMKMAALVLHRGRQSGRQYATPASARLHGDEFLVPLTFGSESDWSRNLRAAGGGHVRWQGREYEVADPEICWAKDIRPLLKDTFGAPERAAFRLIGIKSVMRLKVTGRAG